MSPASVTVRFPTGGTEFRLSEKAPLAGDVLRRNGDNWIVVAVTKTRDGNSTVTLRPGLKPAH